MRPQRHFMLDLETLGRHPLSAFWQIALLEFRFTQNQDTVIVNNSYVAMACPREVRSKVTAGLLQLEMTAVDWTMAQGNAELFKPWWRAYCADETLADSTPYAGINLEVSKLIGGDKSTARIWCKGADFDFTIYKSAMRACGINEPWHYRFQCCMRPVLHMAEDRGKKLSYRHISHDAYDDCVNQVALLGDATRQLFS